MKDIIWVGSSLDDLSKFPETVKDEVGFALYQIQLGLKAKNVKHLTEIDSGVMEIISDFDKNTFRVIYAIKISDVIYVLHSFQKKSKSGIATPKQAIELIKRRLKEVKKSVKERSK